MKQVRRRAGRMEKVMHSVSYRTLWTVVAGCIALGVTAVLIGIQIFRTELFNQYGKHAWDIATFAHQSAEESGADIAGLSDQVLGIYRSLTEEKRDMIVTEEYKAFFSEVDQGEGSVYDTLRHSLEMYIKAEDTDDLYIAMYDRETNALVYILDLQPIMQYWSYPGDWEAVKPEEVEHFLGWDGTGRLYYNLTTSNNRWVFASGLPFRNGAGEICIFIIVDMVTEKIRTDIVEFAVKISLAVLAVTALIALLLDRHIRRNIARPLNALADAASAYAKEKKSGSGAGGHFNGLDTRGGSEMENLCRTMSEMEQDLSGYEETVRRDAAEKERISTELSLAGKIQASALPDCFPAF